MQAYFKMGQATRTSTYVPKLGEVLMQEIDDGSGEKKYRTVVGDGKTGVNDLPSLADYGLHERVIRLEQEVEKLKADKSLELIPEGEGHYTSILGDFYQIFAGKDDSWKFKPKRSMSEKDMLKTLDALRKLKRRRNN